MNKTIKQSALALVCLTLISTTGFAFAAPEDYEFQLVAPEAKQGGGTLVSVKLIDKRTGKPVENAVIFTSQMDMQPEGMEGMTTQIEAMPTSEPGIYAFKTNLTMADGWRLSLAAKVQGEEGTIEGQLLVKAVP